MNCLVAVFNGFVLFATGMRIIAFDFCVPGNMVCTIMSCWEIDIENFSVVINHVQKKKKQKKKKKTPYLAGFKRKLLACRDKF